MRNSQGRLGRQTHQGATGCLPRHENEGRLLALALVVVSGLFVGPRADAQVLNGAFDRDLDGWLNEAPQLELAWDSMDSAGLQSSGSMRMTNSGATDNGGAPGVFQCVPVSGGSTVTLQASLLIPLLQLAPVEAFIFLYFSDGTDCTGGSFWLNDAGPTIETGGSWQQVALERLAPSEARSARIGLGLRKPGGGPLPAQVFWDDVRLAGVTGACIAAFDELCLNADSFKVEVGWRDAAGNSGSGQALPLSGDSGLFWFFDSDNPELLVKVVDGCALNDRFWVFAAGTTDVGFDLDVTHEETGASRRYSNPIGVASDAVTDTDAFAVCP